MADAENKIPLVEIVLNLLEVKAQGADYLGNVKSVGSGRLYGGMVMAQALNAAKSSIEDASFKLHSYHCYFIRPGLEKEPVLYKVINRRDGNFFSNRSIEAYQNNRLIFSLSASFHKDEDMPEHMTAIQIPSRDKSLERWQAIGLRFAERIPKEAHTFFHRKWPFEIYPIDGEKLFSLENEPAKLGFWLKLVDKVTLNEQQHKLLFSYISDLMLLQIAGLPTDFKLWQRKAMYSSLDQCIWFHRQLDVTKWLYFDVESPSYHDARGFVIGKLYSESGNFLATVTQEGLIRSFLM
ncbi:thioesterase family protein [Thiotrichales bacterium 19S3-7]|nr:thioesterase family protein [Thiotrichales bacterium 19S3-7]MCF6801761.1 thioesterase family protein [Thiotrichales bacterium 19S3-11]